MNCSKARQAGLKGSHRRHSRLSPPSCCSSSSPLFPACLFRLCSLPSVSSFSCLHALPSLALCLGFDACALPFCARPPSLLVLAFPSSFQKSRGMCVPTIIPARICWSIHPVPSKSRIESRVSQRRFPSTPRARTVSFGAISEKVLCLPRPLSLAQVDRRTRRVLRFSTQKRLRVYLHGITIGQHHMTS